MREQNDPKAFSSILISYFELFPCCKLHPHVLKKAQQMMTAASQEYSLHAFLSNCDFYRHSVWSQVASAFLSLCLFLTLVNIPGDVLIMKDCIVQCNSVIQTNSLRNTWAIIKLPHAVSRGDVCLTSIWISVTAWVKQEDEKLFPLTNYNFKMTVVKFV